MSPLDDWGPSDEELTDNDSALYLSTRLSSAAAAISGDIYVHRCVQRVTVAQKARP